ncbi:hypothetical protein EDC30_11277 [Paucimonas lemoignei]|uniref:PXPV repeat-containing protein n=1 Tax=Paucimonas lemoignei TaxID=29443 RepID=A0A4R3HRV4_PAULE|nr:hypothetical protein [Paucimonas lemoignei]TCS34745.1 hypothetical protein EDC30_11277 [Paucimonas lemoignei]
MNRLFTLITGAAILGAGLMAASPAAMARDRVDWSVSVGSGGYAYPAPVVVAPPPPVVVAPPPPVVVQRPVPMVGYAPYYYAPPPAYWRGRGHHHHGHWDGGHRHGR